MPIKHLLTADGDPLVGEDDWNANHAITNMLGYELVETITESSGATTFTFSGLTSEYGTEYLIDYILKAVSGDTTISIIFNGDNTSGNYGTYMQLQETDGNNHHLTNWTSTSTIVRIYNQTPYISHGKIQIMDLNTGIEGRATYRSEFSMYRAGWGENGGSWYKSSDSGSITSLGLISSQNITGTIRLWKQISI